MKCSAPRYSGTRPTYGQSNRRPSQEEKKLGIARSAPLPSRINLGQSIAKQGGDK